MPQPTFVHLRLHSEYSISDGMVRVDEAVAAAKRDAMPALALTDLNNFFGLVKFYKAARGAGIKPVAGCDVYISNDADQDRPYRMLLLCQSNAGYLLLCRLLSRAYLENQHRGRAELRREWLHQDSDGLIALSGAHLGDIGSALSSGNVAQARLFAREWSGVFGNRYYIEVQRTGFPGEEHYLHAATQLAAEFDLPVVATHPVQFLGAEDFKAHEARVCIAEGYVLNDKRRARTFTARQYFTTQAEMAALFADLPEALQNSVEIARRCNLSLVLDKPRLPDFPTPDGQGLDDYLREQAELGLQQRMVLLYPDQAERAGRQAQYQARLDFEINTIIKMGFSGYFLIVADFIRWAKHNGVPVGPGRGSGAGSLVAYSLGITDLDPLRYALLFERFLNPERVSMPDFDVDFCQDGRERVIDYVKQKYGAASVAQIATFGTMASKAVIRDVGRVMDFPYGLCDRLSKAIPLEGVKPVSLKKARELEPEINSIAESEEGVPELLELAGRLEDLTRNVGMHAGGVLIAPGQLTDFCPLYCADSSTSVVSQFDKDDVESIGLVKFDFLGLRTLTILDWAMRHIKRLEKQGLRTEVGGLGETTSPQSSVPEPQSFTLETLPLDDAATYALLKKGNTTAVFQLESRGMKDMLGRARPDCFEDIIALVALYRPGPMDLIPDFIRRKHGEKFDYPHPAVEPVLSETYGIMVYQEQVMQMAQLVGGYTLGGADLLRRAMGKKKAEEMAQQREIFISGALKNGTSKEVAGNLFDLMEKFAGYGFNKSHAAAYALVAYQTAYLKTHHPAAFMAATLSGDLDNTEKVSIFYADTLQQNIRVLLPDVNSSGYVFSPVDEATIAYGLGAIKGTGEAAIASIVKARASGPFKDLFDFCRRVDKRIVNRRTIEALIKAGAFDSINDHRAALMASVDAALASADQHARAANQNSLFGSEESDAVLIVQTADVPRWRLREQLAHEKSSLGIYLGGHPYQEYAGELANFIKLKLADLTPKFVGQTNGSGNGSGHASRRGVPVVLAGIVSGLRIQQTRRGRMAVVTLDDGSAQVELTVFNEIYEASRPWIREDELLVVRGKASLDEYSGNVRVTGDELFDFASARSHFAQQLALHCNGKAGIAQLKKLFTPYRDGKCPVRIHYHNDNASCQLRLGDEWQVTLHDDLLRDLRELLHEENVKVVYAAVP
ncbi:MAG: DNA polymerase III, alpha subunit [Candidatus Gallionella acididurans]|uniref:DNA polymerase III subunit alpha n=1 Tax=Candidatus Gallionella acididurans TaxID=1796491 RepID=A0A139BSN7_9PROT|nr:MAG: DNA polymerase III, alpha subunit [Candidatus Gallionella acididurans]